MRRHNSPTSATTVHSGEPSHSESARDAGEGRSSAKQRLCCPCQKQLGKQRIDVHDSTTIARMFAGEEHQQSRVIVMGRLSGTLPSLGVANSTQCQGVPVLCAYQHDLATAAVGCVRFPTVQGSRQEGVSTKPASKK